MIGVKKAIAPTGVKKKISTRKKPETVSIEKIIGNTVTTQARVAVNPTGDEIAYCAGATVVVYCPKRNRQIKFLQNPSENKTFSCVCYSADGKKIAAGEYGYQPSVLVWDVASGKIISDAVKEERHKHGVDLIEFSPDSKYLVTVGNEHDATVRIWLNKGKNYELSLTKKSPRKTYSLAFSSDGSYFVTSGVKHVFYWTFRNPTFNSKTFDVLVTKAILNSFVESTFVGVTCPKQTKEGIYCLTSDGILCLIDAKRNLDKWVELKVEAGFSLSVTDAYICCGCAAGFVRLFEPKTLKYKGTLPKPPPMHTHVTSSNWGEKDRFLQLPVPAAVSTLIKNNFIVAFYQDRTMIVWDIKSLQAIVKYRSSVGHSDSIMDIDYVTSENSPLPPGTFATCSTDNTIRFWNIESLNQNANINARASVAQQSVFGKDLLHILKIPMMRNEESETGVKCVKFSPDGMYVATGDFQGNVRVYEVQNFSSITDTPAHDNVVTSLDFVAVDSSRLFLATGSRDRHIHLFELKNNRCSCLSTVNDHSGAITSLKFAVNEGIKLLSCGTDKSIKFRNVDSDGDVRLYDNKAIPFGTTYDMDIDRTQKYAITTGQDKRLNIWDIQKKRNCRSYKTEVEADMLKVKVDPAGLFASVSFTDKTLKIFDFFSGGSHHVVKGHSEVITAITFSNDCKRMITVSGDGCIFVWKLPNEMLHAMQDRLHELSMVRPKPPVSTPRVVNNEPDTAPIVTPRPKIHNDQVASLRDIALRNSEDINKTLENPIEIDVDSDLPTWARPRTQENKDDAQERRPKSAWSERPTFQIPNTEGALDNVDGSDSIDLDAQSKKDYQNLHAIRIEEDDDVIYTDESEAETDGETEREIDKEEEEDADRNVLVFNLEKAESTDDFNIRSLEKVENPEEAETTQKKIEVGDELEMDDDDVVNTEPISVESASEEKDEKISEFIFKHYGNLDKPVNRNALRESVTAKFKLSKSQSEESPPEPGPKPAQVGRSELDKQRQILKAMENGEKQNDLEQPQETDDLDEMEKSLPASNYENPKPPSQPHPRSSLFDRLAIIQNVKTDRKVEDKKTYRPLKKEIDEKLDEHKRFLLEREQKREIKPVTEEQEEEERITVEIQPHKQIDNFAEQFNADPNQSIDVVIHAEEPKSPNESQIIGTPTQEESEMWSPVPTQTPRVHTAKSISVCKSNIESLSSIFSETMQSIDDLTQMFESQNHTVDQSEVHQVNELINSFQDVLDNMRAKLSQKINSTSVSTMFGRTSQTRETNMSVNSSLQQKDVAEFLDLLGPMIADVVAKKIDEHMRK